MQNNQYQPMSLERCKRLFNAFIDHLCNIEDSDVIIRDLLNIGFTEEELIHEFYFCEHDVKDVIESMKKDEEE